MKNALYIVLGTVLGWLLGLFTPWLAEIIQRPYRRSQVKRAIFVELRDLRAKLTSVVLQVEMNRGSLDAATLKWFQNLAQSDPVPFRKLGGMPWELIENVTDEQVKAVSRLNASPANVKLNFKRYSVPFLDTHLSALNLFCVEFQRLAHGIRGQLLLMNQEIDVAWFYFQRTFDSLSELNRSIIQGNHEMSHDFIGRTARQIVDDITTILEL